MSAVSLICHPSTPCAYVREVNVRVDALGEDLLVFYYQIEGDVDQLWLPAQTRSAHADGLWRRTCLEAFIKTPHSRVYFELNFSPSSEWAVYRFDDYRQGMAAVRPAQAPRIICRRREDRLEADVDVHLASLDALAASELQLGICAVLENHEGEISQWALAHPPGKPDFHHPDGFTLTLPPSDGESR